MTDAAARELISAFVQVLETVERQADVIRALLLSHETEQRPGAVVIQQYRNQCDAVERQVAELRAMLATLSGEL